MPESLTGIDHAPHKGMASMHSLRKEQREAVRDLVHTVLVRDLGSFSPERFKDWIKHLDAQFAKVAMMLRFELHDRSVTFNVKEKRTGRSLFRFVSSTRVRFEDKDVVMSYEEMAPKF